ncbi:MAG: hypothetical protein D6767_07960 [Candidatus Hydrogenedentota bacterium]|nr:MAG: hypothetical protein D6767_07960 [Candidatus Hydrogenedentota bacterium]
MLFAEELGFDEEFYSTKRKIRITDGIGMGPTKEIARQNAIIDARKKALRRVTSTFRFMLSESKNGEFVSSSVEEEVHAKIIDKERIINVKYDHGIQFKNGQVVAVVDCIITVSFLDLDFFAQEMLKTAEAACIRSLYIAGWGQIFNRAYFSGITMSLITYGSLGYAYYRSNMIEEAEKAYKAAKDPVEAERRYAQLRDHKNVSKMLYIVGFVTWAYSVWDAFEDRSRADEVLDQVHDRYFKKFPYHRKYSFFQEIMMDMRPEW